MSTSGVTVENVSKAKFSSVRPRPQPAVKQFIQGQDATQKTNQTNPVPHELPSQVSPAQNVKNLSNINGRRFSDVGATRYLNRYQQDHQLSATTIAEISDPMNQLARNVYSQLSRVHEDGPKKYKVAPMENSPMPQREETVNIIQKYIDQYQIADGDSDRKSTVIKNMAPLADAEGNIFFDVKRASPMTLQNDSEEDETDLETEDEKPLKFGSDLKRLQTNQRVSVLS